MNILYVVPKPNVGGLQTTLRNRILALQKHGIRAEIIFLDHGEGEYIFSKIPYSIIKSGPEFGKKVARGNFDYISFVYSPEFLAYVPKRFTGKIIYEVRGWNEKIANYVENLESYGKVHGVVCIAKHLKATVKKHLKQKTPVFVDGNTVHPMFHYVRSADRSWKDCPVPRKNHKVIAYVGRVERSKNWRQFVRICAKLNETDKIEPWIICNRDTTRELPRLLHKCIRKNLDELVRIIPRIPNHYMPEVYSVIQSSGGCILSTSTREGLGNHILEPMACGVPVVSSDVPGKNEIITHKTNGLLYELEKTDRAVRYVRRVIHDKKLRARLAENGLKKIKSEYSPKKYVSFYLKILSKL